MTSMMRLRLRVTTCATLLRRWKSNTWLTGSTNMGSEMDARLHTATSSGLVYSTISVQRLEHRMVPRFCWLDLRLQASLYSM